MRRRETDGIYTNTMISPSANKKMILDTFWEVNNCCYGTIKK